MEQISLKTMSQIIKKAAIRNGQHGLTDSKSHMTNLIAFYSGVTGSVIKGRAVDVVCLDFNKAFERVFQNIIVAKSLRQSLVSE